MLGNTFGRMFRVTCCGESYGRGLMTIVDGVPPGLKITREMVQAELDKRRPGQSPIDSPRKETDQVEIVAGMLEGVTTGAPVGMIIYNVDTQQVHVEQYRAVKDVFRPGHANFTFFVKYGQYADWCGAGRSSGRETVGRVAGGAIAKVILDRDGIEVLAYTKESHGIKMRDMTYEQIKANYRKNDINCPDLEAGKRMEEDLHKVRDEGDTAGGIIEIVARGVPAGWGEQIFDKLKATLAQGIMSIGAVQGMEFGDGFKCATMTGSQWNDQPFVENGAIRFHTNHCGGLLGGMSNGEDIVIRIAVKATPTISKDQDTIDVYTMEKKKLSAITRRDITLLPRVAPVAEAMVRIALVDAMYMSAAYDNAARLDPHWKEIGKPRHTAKP
ncbi:MAG: chorismate synthase [Phycisphaerae bacterium]